MVKEKILQEASNDTSEVIISFEEYIAQLKPNPGLVASFKVENANDLKDRSIDEWTEALVAQSNKVYK